MGERGADRDALALAARQLARIRVVLPGETDPLEQLVRAAIPLGAAGAGQAELHADQLPRGEVGVERARVVLLHVAEHARAVVGEPPPAEPAEVGAEHARRARRRPLQTGEDAQERRLPRPARAEHDEHLPLLDRERQPLQRRRVALGCGEDAEEVAHFDRAHTVLLVDTRDEHGGGRGVGGAG